MLASEMIPYAKTGGLADVVGALPAALRALGHEVIVALPRYRGIEPGRYRMRHVGEVQVPLGRRVVAAGVDQLPEEGTPYVLFIDHRSSSTARRSAGRPRAIPDNGERFALFARAALAACAPVWSPDVVRPRLAGGPRAALWPRQATKHFAKAGRVLRSTTSHTRDFAARSSISRVCPGCFRPEVSVLREGILPQGGARLQRRHHTVSRKYAEEIRRRSSAAGWKGCSRTGRAISSDPERRGLRRLGSSP
jgi:glycogen synthase